MLHCSDDLVLRFYGRRIAFLKVGVTVDKDMFAVAATAFASAATALLLLLLLLLFGGMKYIGTKATTNSQYKTENLL